MKSLKIYIWIVLGIFLWWVASNLYLGVITPPSEGDSLIIHIPAAERILNGTIYNLDYTKDLFYPSSVEILLALFILLKIPLGLFNVFGIVALFFGTYLLGKELFKDKNYSIVFASSISLLHGIIRWGMTQKPDIIMTASLAFILFFIIKKSRGFFDYLLLGICCGIFIGAKFNGPIFLLVILLPFYKVFSKEVSLKKLIVFSIPVILIGFSWYIRNIYITGDPFYFPDYSSIVSQGSIANYTLYAYLNQPIMMANAYLSEFMLWSFGIILVPVYLYMNRNKLKEKGNALILKLFASAFVVLIISFAFPYRALFHQMVGTMRYTLPMIFLIIFCVFLIFKKWGHEKLLIFTAIPMIVVSQIEDYHPKIIIPLVVVIWIVYFHKKIVAFIER